MGRLPNALCWQRWRAAAARLAGGGLIVGGVARRVTAARARTRSNQLVEYASYRAFRRLYPHPTTWWVSLDTALAYTKYDPLPMPEA